MGLGKDSIRIAVCDDEEQFRIILKSAIETYYRKNKHTVEISVFESGEELLRMGNRVFEFDCIFLDVVMGEIGGISTAQKIRKLSSEITIVFISAILNTWNKGYEVGAFRYIIKDPKTFRALLTECLDALTKKFFSDIPMIKIETKNGEKTVPIRNIIYLESKGHILVYHICYDGIWSELYSRNKLNKCEKDFLEHGFVRLHQSFLVNSNYIINVKNYRVTILGNSIELPISKKRYGTVKNAIMLARDDF